MSKKLSTIILLIFILTMHITSHANDLILVIASGYGVNSNEALNNAYSVAVEQAAGVIISTETYVLNGELINDTVLIKSYGFIEKYDIIASNPEKSGYKVTIRAYVSQEKLSKELTSIVSRTNSVEIGGSSIAAKVLTANKLYNIHKEELSAKLLSIKQQLMDSVVISSINTNFLYDKLENNNVPVVVTANLSIDYKSFSTATNQLINTLASIGIKPIGENNLPGTFSNTYKSLNIAYRADNGRLMYIIYTLNNDEYDMIKELFILPKQRCATSLPATNSEQTTGTMPIHTIIKDKGVYIITPVFQRTSMNYCEIRSQVSLQNLIDTTSINVFVE